SLLAVPRCLESNTNLDRCSLEPASFSGAQDHKWCGWIHILTNNAHSKVAIECAFRWEKRNTRGRVNQHAQIRIETAACGNVSCKVPGYRKRKIEPADDRQLKFELESRWHGFRSLPQVEQE